MTPQQIESNLTEIKAEIEREVSSGDIQAVQDKLLRLTTFMGLSAEIMRHAKAMVLKKQGFWMDHHRNDGLPASVLKNTIEAKMWNEISIYDYAERINAAITHACDGLRTIVSLYKEEMRNHLNQP